MKIILRFFLGLIALFFVGLISLGVMLYTADPRQYQLTMLEQFNERTGLDLEVRGNMIFSFKPQPKMILSDISLGMGKEYPGYRIRAKKFEIDFHWSDFFKKTVDTYVLKMEGGSFHFKDKLGKDNKYNFKKFSSILKLSAKNIEVKDFYYVFSNNIASGDFNLKLNKKLFFSGDLFLDKLEIFHKNNEVVNFDILNNFNANLNLKVKKFFVKNILFQNIETKINIKNGSLDIPNLALKLGGSALNLNLNIENNKKNQSPKVIINLKGDKVVLRKLQDGLLKFNIDGEGVGKTLEQMIATFNGKALFELGPFVIKNKSQNIHVECAVAKMLIKNGIADLKSGIGIQSREGNILGGGTINLINNTLDLQLGNDLKVTGSIVDPIYKISPVKALSKGGSIIAAIATGGLSLIGEKIFQEASKIKDPCGIVLRSEPKQP